VIKFVRPGADNQSTITDFIIEILNTTEYRFLDLGIESADKSLTYLQSIVIKPMAQDRTQFHFERRENLTEVVRALPAVTNAERGQKMTLACSILVPVADPQYAVVDWTVFHAGSGNDVGKPESVFFYKNIGGEVEASTFGDAAYEGSAKAEPFSKKGGRSGSIVSSFLGVTAFDPVDNSGEYSCHLHVDGVTIKMTSLVLPAQVPSLFGPRDVRIKAELCDGTEEFFESHVGCVRCTALGFPVPKLSIFRNDTALPQVAAAIQWGRPRHSTIAFHLIDDAQADDEGVYECRATQRSTGVTERVELNVTVTSATGV
jgi:hypothetical protein